MIKRERVLNALSHKPVIECQKVKLGMNEIWQIKLWVQIFLLTISIMKYI
jgi:hypothetical protein